MKKLFLYACIACSFTSCVLPSPATRSANNLAKNKTVKNQAPPNAKPGSCYAKCLMPAKYKHDENDYLVYTGSDSEAEYTKMEEVILKPAFTKWEKRVGDKNCLSDDPNDCLVWCLVNVPAETEALQIVTDTTHCKEYEWQTVRFKKRIKKGGQTEWKETICGDKVTSYFIAEVQESLKSNGFDPGPADDVLGARTKSALTKFQKDNGLPVGQLDFESLDALGVSY